MRRWQRWVVRLTPASAGKQTSITALGSIRDGLPGHYAYAWRDALAPTVDYSDMITGALWSIGYAIIAIWFAFWYFLRKDITS